MLSTEDRGYSACNVGLLTLQLNWPDAHTLGELLHTTVLFCPSSRPVSPDELVEDPDVEDEYPDAHALAVWQTLQPVPVHPLWQEQPAAVRLANPFELIGAKERSAPWKIFPPHAG